MSQIAGSGGVPWAQRKNSKSISKRVKLRLPSLGIQDIDKEYTRTHTHTFMLPFADDAAVPQGCLIRSDHGRAIIASERTEHRHALLSKLSKVVVGEKKLKTRRNTTNQGKHKLD